MVWIISMIALGLSAMNSNSDSATDQSQGIGDIYAQLLVFPDNKNLEDAKISFTVVKKKNRFHSVLEAL